MIETSDLWRILMDVKGRAGFGFEGVTCQNMIVVSVCCQNQPDGPAGILRGLQKQRRFINRIDDNGFVCFDITDDIAVRRGDTECKPDNFDAHDAATSGVSLRRRIISSVMVLSSLILSRLAAMTKTSTP